MAAEQGIVEAGRRKQTGPMPAERQPLAPAHRSGNPPARALPASHYAIYVTGILYMSTKGDIRGIEKLLQCVWLARHPSPSSSHVASRFALEDHWKPVLPQPFARRHAMAGKWR